MMRRSGIPGAFLAALSVVGTAVAQPLERDGGVGATDYRLLPFEKQVFQASWGASVGLFPAELWFEANPHSFYADPSKVLAAHYAAVSLDAHGVVPTGGAQRWEDTYVASFVTPFAGEPDFVANDRKLGQFATLPEFGAWRDFVTAHPQYWDRASDGGTMPGDPLWRKLGGQWGHISPMTPLDPADCPAGMAACTWGDLFAWRWSRTSALSGAYGITLADFTDSMPARSSNFHDFNPRIVADFARQYHHPELDGLAAPAAARWIVANAFNDWNDFLGIGYGKFFAALARRIGAATGKQALILGGAEGSPAWRRLVGTDARLIALNMDPKNYMVHWDSEWIQQGRGGPIAHPPIEEVVPFGLGAAREPRIRNGAILEADDPAYWAAIGEFYPSLAEDARKEVGTRLLKRIWLWSAWTHIADRAGQVRRALAYVSRDYWDGGSVELLGPLPKLIATVWPAGPFGAAVWYSVAVERAVEADVGRRKGPDAPLETYMDPSVVGGFLDAGGPVGYYVTDAALPKIEKGSDSAPSAWIVLDARGMLPTAERAALEAVAPVVTSAAELAKLPGQPLTLSPGLSGFGFIDQAGRLVLVVSNSSTKPDAADVTGIVSLAGLKLGDGPHKLRDLLTGSSEPITVTNGNAGIPVALRRWDTLALALEP